MSELTLTILRMGLLALLWVFVFSIVGVLRGDLYGTRVTRRSTRAERQASARTGERRRRRGPQQLVVTSGPLTGTQLPIREGGTLIGRSPECALVLDDDYASGRHARIYQDRGTWYVEDLGSTNGTYADAVKVGQPTRVDTGSAIRIGRTVIELQR